MVFLDDFPPKDQWERGVGELRLLIFCSFHGYMIRGHQVTGATNWPVQLAVEQSTGGGMG